jgi:hypothetical protein
MTRIEVHNRCSDRDSHRAARVKSLFSCESGTNFDLKAELPIDGDDWRLGDVVGPSGSGKSSIGRAIWGQETVYSAEGAWPADAPIVAVIDEFSSVVDRKIARFGALAFAKSWKRGGWQCVLLSCHYDILD